MHKILEKCLLFMRFLCSVAFLLNHYSAAFLCVLCVLCGKKALFFHSIRTRISVFQAFPAPSEIRQRGITIELW